MRKISSFIMACAMCLSMTVVGIVAPQIAVQAEETAVVEKKEAPTEVATKYQKNWGYDCKISYTGTDSSWLSSINKVEVNGKEYTKVEYEISVFGNTNYFIDTSNKYVLIGEGNFNEEPSNTNKVVIYANGYKNLVLEVNEKDTTVAIHTNHKGGTATCTEKAVCDFCGEEYGEFAAHNYGDTYESDGTHHWKKCQTEGCDATTEKEEHKGGVATTTEKAKCDVCGTEYGELKKEDPKPADKTTEDGKDDTKPADTTTEGKKDDTKPAATTTVKNDTKPATQPAKNVVKAKKVVINKKKIVLKQN